LARIVLRKLCMRKRFLLPALLTLAAGIPGCTGLSAQSAGSPPEQHHKTGSINGKVRYYEPGKKISISIRPQVQQTYDLSASDTRFQLDPGLQVGSKVEIVEEKDEGHNKVVVIRLRR